MLDYWWETFPDDDGSPIHFLCVAPDGRAVAKIVKSEAMWRTSLFVRDYEHKLTTRATTDLDIVKTAARNFAILLGLLDGPDLIPMRKRQ